MTVAKKRKAATLWERACAASRGYGGKDFGVTFRQGWLNGYRAAQRDQRKARAGKGRK